MAFLFIIVYEFYEFNFAQQNLKMEHTFFFLYFAHVPLRDVAFEIWIQKNARHVSHFAYIPIGDITIKFGFFEHVFHCPTITYVPIENISIKIRESKHATHISHFVYIPIR